MDNAKAAFGKPARRSRVRLLICGTAVDQVRHIVTCTTNVGFCRELPPNNGGAASQLRANLGHLGSKTPTSKRTSWHKASHGRKRVDRTRAEISAGNCGGTRSEHRVGRKLGARLQKYLRLLVVGASCVGLAACGGGGGGGVASIPPPPPAPSPTNASITNLTVSQTFATDASTTNVALNLDSKTSGAGISGIMEQRNHGR